MVAAVAAGRPPSSSTFIGEDAILGPLEVVSRSLRTGTVSPTMYSRVIVTRQVSPCSVADPLDGEV